MNESLREEIMRLLRIAMEAEKSLLRSHEGDKRNGVELAETRRCIYELLDKLRSCRSRRESDAA